MTIVVPIMMWEVTMLERFVGKVTESTAHSVRSILTVEFAVENYYY